MPYASYNNYQRIKSTHIYYKIKISPRGNIKII